MGKKDKRIDEILEVTKTRSFVAIKELADIMSVSEMTIRRDVAVLQQNRLVYNLSGNIVYRHAFTMEEETEYALTEQQLQRNMQKDAIGRKAAELVEDNDIIIIDTGSTTERIVPYLPQDKNLSVLCYNSNILMSLYKNPGVEILLAGGRYHANTQMFESEQGIDFIRSIRAGKVFVSAAGVHAKLGITCRNAYEVPNKHAILQSSLQKILVVDSSKFNVLHPAHFCDLTEIDTVVTDDGISDDWRKHLDFIGITLLTCNVRV